MSIGCVKCRGNWNLGCTPASSVAQQHRQTQAETHTRTRTFSQFGEDSGKKGRSHWHICSGHSFIQYIAYFRIRSSAGSDRWNFYITWDGLVLIWASLIPPNTQTHTHILTHSPNSWKRGSIAQKAIDYIWRDGDECFVFVLPLPISREKVFTVLAHLGS